MMKKALILSGGWPGHSPAEISRLVACWLADDGFSVDIVEDMAVLDDEDRLGQTDLFIPNWTMGELSPQRAKAVAQAVEAGMGLGGWHGGMGDAFRANTFWQFLVGGQFVNHFAGDKLYRVEIVDHDHPVSRGLQGFEVVSEQYHMHIDPAVQVLASTTMDAEEKAPWIEGTVMPVAWVRPWGSGRVFYCSIGHKAEDFAIPEVELLIRRGLGWAAKE